MARITPAQILALGEPMEDVYNEIVDELLVNIGKHLRGNSNTWTAYWELEKLEEMGQLTAENAAIINKHIANMPDILKDTMEDTRKLALAGIESKLAKAAASGYLTPPITDSSVEVLRNYINQASEKLNLTNTIMLQSSVDMYQQAVGMTAERAEEIRAAGELIEGKVAAKIATGTYARQKALKETIQKLSDVGLTGFYDRAGRSWSPEAYVNMVTRTTVHNVAIESTKARMNDYGTDVIQISSHAGARPGCYPYQGKFYSWNGGSGKVELGDGRVVSYEPLSSTTYGEPAGLFGVNCGHYPIPIIPGITIPHGADNIEPQAQNDRNYQESQQQRSIEREIRKAKRVVEMEGNLATQEQKDKVKELQAKMRDFTNQTGRARRYDRERVAIPNNKEKKSQINAVVKFNKKYKAKNSNELLENYQTAENINAKLTGYVLNANNERGKDKAVVFESTLGYNLSNADELASKIRDGLSVYKALPGEPNEYGNLYNVKMLITGPNGNIKPVKTGWIIRDGETAPRMVTAYVDNYK